MAINSPDLIMNMKSKSHPAGFPLSRRDLIRTTLSSTTSALIACSRSGRPISGTTEIRTEDPAMVRPTAKEAATRLVILKYHILHAWMLPGRKTLSEKEKERFPEETSMDGDKFWRPLKDSGLWPAMSPKE